VTYLLKTHVNLGYSMPEPYADAFLGAEHIVVASVSPAKIVLKTVAFGDYRTFSGMFM